MKKNFVLLLILVTLVFSAEIAKAGEIHDGAKNGDLAKVKSLLQKDPKLANSEDEYQRTPLFFASYSKNKEIVMLLISKGAEVNKKDKFGLTALNIAASKNAGDIAAILISKGADVNSTDVQGDTPLHEAASKNSKATASLLISKGASVKAKNFKSSTPLHSAALMNSKDVALVLISKGADINAKDVFGGGYEKNSYLLPDFFHNFYCYTTSLLWRKDSRCREKR